MMQSISFMPLDIDQSFITGQLPIRTGMTTIGIPGSILGLQIASML